jgi:kinesin family protein 4/21/27
MIAGGSGANLELQPSASAPLLRNSKARREWIEQEMELCSTSWQYQKVCTVHADCAQP